MTNEHDIIAKLKNAKEAEAPSHQAALRSTLLSMHAARRARFEPLQNFLNFISMKKYSIPVGVFAVVALAFVINFGALDASKAQAEELAHRAYARAISISPEMRAQFEAQMKADMQETLKEALAAKDLRILTPEEFKKESPFTISTTSNVGFQAVGGGVGNAEFRNVKVIKGEGGSVQAGEGGATFTVSTGGPIEATSGDIVTVSASAMMPMSGVATAGTVAFNAATTGPSEMSQPVKYLSYTDPRGNKTVLGLDKDDTPVFKFSQLNAADIVHMQDGSIGIQGQAVMIRNLEEGTSDSVK